MFSAARTTAGKITSVVINNDISGVEQLESWKVEAEDIADAADPAQRSHYNRFKGLADLWVNRKKLELSAAAASTLSAKVDLSSASLSAPLRQSYERLVEDSSSDQAGASMGAPLTRGILGGGFFLAATAAQSIDKIIVKGKTDQANLISEQLESLRLKPWPSPASAPSPSASGDQ
jgi:hypothetical protein